MLFRSDRETRWTGILAEKLYDKGYRIIEEGLCGRTSVFDDATRDGRNGAKVLPMLLETHAPLDQVVSLSYLLVVPGISPYVLESPKHNISFISVTFFVIFHIILIGII